MGVRGKHVAFAEAITLPVVSEASVNLERKLQGFGPLGTHVRVVKLVPAEGLPNREERVFANGFQDRIPVSLWFLLERICDGKDPDKGEGLSPVMKVLTEIDGSATFCVNGEALPRSLPERIHERSVLR